MGIDADTLGERLWLVWRNYPAGPLPEDPRERDLNAFAAGIKATVLGFIGIEGGRLADVLVADLMMRDAIVTRLDAEDDRRRDEGPTEAGPSLESR